MTNNPKLQILYLVSMPIGIGNLDEITPRALSVLESVPVIVVEEYRQGMKTLKQAGIDLSGKKILQLNEHVEGTAKLSRGYQRGRQSKSGRSQLRSQSNWDEFMAELLDSDQVALISDAGCPVLADPGYRLTRELGSRRIPITHVSGASSLISGLLLSGFSPDSFYYAGFLPQNHTLRERALEKLAGVKDLLVIMETPYRLNTLIDSIAKVFSPSTAVAVTFSLTTPEEEVFRGTLQEARKKYGSMGKNRRPFVLFVNNRSLPTR